MVIPCFKDPVEVDAATNAKTIAELRKELNAYKAKKQQASSNQTLTQNQIFQLLVFFYFTFEIVYHTFIIGSHLFAYTITNYEIGLVELANQITSLEDSLASLGNQLNTFVKEALDSDKEIAAIEKPPQEVEVEVPPTVPMTVLLVTISPTLTFIFNMCM